MELSAFRSCRAAVVALALNAIVFQGAALAADIPWQQKPFNRSFPDEDIRNVLTLILAENGLRADFRPGIQITGAYNLDMPLQAAFDKLISENNLEASYDPATRVVTIAARLPSRIITLTQAKPADLQRAKEEFKLGGNLIPDKDTGLILATGTAQQIQQLEELAKRLDQKMEQLKARLVSDTELGTRDAARRAAEADARDRELQAEIRARLRDDVLNTQTKVITIKYANVGPTTQVFQGQSITLPGIDETLRSMLGLNDAKVGPPGAPGAPTPLEQQELARIRREMGQVPPVISVDPRTNSVIVRGSPGAIREVEALIARLDQPLPLVEIEVMIVRATRGVAEELGIRWGASRVLAKGRGTYGLGVNTGINPDNLESPLMASQQVTPTSTVSTPGGTNGSTVIKDSGYQAVPVPPLDPYTLLPTSLGGTVAAFVFRGNAFALQTQINALANASKLQTIAAPRVVTLNNLQAKVTNDRTQYLAVPGTANTPGGYQEVKAGLTATITPALIQREESGEPPLIRLKINAQDKDIRTSPQGRPTLAGNEVQTEVVIPDGSTFVMGGLMNDYRLESNEKIPGLGDIPLLGELFKSRASSSELDETIFFITPHLVQPSDVYAQDIAQRRYLQTQRAKLAEMRQDIQSNSQLIDLSPVVTEEDE